MAEIWVTIKLAVTIEVIVVATTSNHNYIVATPKPLAYVTNKREFMQGKYIQPYTNYQT
jgi:hypothetical protein